MDGAEIESRQNTSQAANSSRDTSLSTCLVTANGQIHLDIPDGVLPGFLIEAFNATCQGDQSKARELLTEENVAVIDRLVAEKYSGAPIMLAVLAMVLRRTQQPEKALQRYQQVSELERHALVYNEMAMICGDLGFPSQVLAYRSHALEMASDDLNLQECYARDLVNVGRIEECIELLEGLVARGEASMETHSNLVLWAHGIPQLTQSQLLGLHRDWARVHAPAHLARQQHANDPDPNRRLRIGYISSAFSLTSNLYNFEPIIENHDRSKVEVFGYVADSVSEVPRRMISRFDTYRAIRHLDDSAVVELILKDSIDILLIFFAHSSGHRLRVLAYKPAPIQVNLSYLNTLGMSQIDYRITDIDFDPPGSEAGYVEELVRLPGGHTSWRQPDNMPPVSPLPALHNDRITFGSFNTYVKMNEYTLGLWAQVLGMCPDSRMLIKCKAGRDPEIRNRIQEQFRHYHIDSERVNVIGHAPMKQHLEMYNRVDVSLDTYPYCGHMTTVESLFMGVPVITLAGKRFVDRASLAFLKQMGLECCVASTPEQYIAKAAALAGNHDLLAKLRGALRGRMLASPLCDVRRLCQALEASYRQMWQKWCHKQQNALISSS